MPDGSSGNGATPGVAPATVESVRDYLVAEHGLSPPYADELVRRHAGLVAAGQARRLSAATVGEDILCVEGRGGD